MSVIDHASRSSIYCFKTPADFSPEDILSRVGESCQIACDLMLAIKGPDNSTSGSVFTFRHIGQ